MIKKKGFTLIELLAVIVILAIIALIAVPIILNIVSRSKKSAFLDSAYGLVESAKLLYAESILDGGLSEEKTFSFDNGKPSGLEYSGSSPKGGMLIVTPNGEISIAVHNHEWCAIKGFSDGKVTLTKYEEGKCMLSENEDDPVIVLNGDTTIYVELNGSYNELGAKASTRGGDVLEYSTEMKKGDEVVSNIDTSVEGTYKVTYSTSSNDKTVSITRTVIILQMIPSITMTESNDTYVKEKEVLINVSGIRPNKVESFTYEIKKDGTSIQTETVTGLTQTLTFNETGNYEVIVSVTDNNGHSNTLSKMYKIDTTKPSITVPENTVIKITEVTGYDLMTGVVVSDNVDLSPKVEMIGGLSAILGEQTVTYKAIDEAGNEESVTRKFTVVEAEGPILNFSNMGSELWTQDQIITVTATDNSNLKTFTYEVIKDGTSKGVTNVEVSGKSASVDIPLNESGIYSIKLNGNDEHNNTNTLSSGEYKIDVTDPVVGSVTPSGTMGSNSWYTSNVTFTVTNGTDGLSGHKSTTVSPTSLTSNTSGTSVTVTTEDNAGNKVTKTFGPYKIDKTKPTFTVKDTGSVTVNKGASNAIQSTYFETPTWSVSGTGSVTCKNGSTTVTNTSSLAVGTHTITCTATGQNGLTAPASKTIIIKALVADTTGANKPTLSNGLVPIKWNGSNWIKADINNLSDENQWYDYNSQMWANAASVTSSYRNVAVGTVIPESAINAYFVWIPRYEYQYTNLGTNYAGGSAAQPGQININFIATSETSPSINYKIHPAFMFGDKELSGIWVGKFETTGDANTPTIKPNLSSLRSQNVSTQFTTAQKFGASGNTYGISTSADAHMMKNSEWGAVAYLSQSKYGKYGNSSYSGVNREVYINNYWNNATLTGCSAGAPSTKQTSSCTNAYNVSPEGTGASTTGTIYGVYDMSGGAYEYVMGVYSNTIGSSGFSGLPATKYYDNYTTTTATTACSNGICYGHALSETSGWYSAHANFVGPTWPWFQRGGDYSNTTGAGVFNFSVAGYYGNARIDISFRTVLLD